MNPTEQAKLMVAKFQQEYFIVAKMTERKMYNHEAKQCALVAVQMIINANPHSNPLNTDVHSTMDYWEQVKLAIKEFAE